VYVEHHVRDLVNPEIWTLRRLERLSDQMTIKLPECGFIDIAIADVYDDLELGFPQ
jgi:hypothetical protein